MFKRTVTKWHNVFIENGSRALLSAKINRA
jgi:hypothetical protein